MVTQQISHPVIREHAGVINLNYHQFNAELIPTEMESGLKIQTAPNSYNHLYPDIIGTSPEMQKIYHLMSVVAPTNSTVLLLGETGTGKEVIARGIHQSSARKNKPMVTINCAALPVHLIESELFGHERGAFTGSVERRIGKFEMAHQGTIFLDEIGEMPPELQIKLLRVIQEREFERIGGKTTIRVDVRIVAATNRDLSAEVDARRFRADLYYRLNVFPISLPALRDRGDDVIELANSFLKRYNVLTGKKLNIISSKVISQLKNYSWPGNVRQLENLIERSILLSQGNILREVCLPGERPVNNEKNIFENRTLTEVEKKHIIAVLRRCGGKIAGPGGAARYLDLPPTTLHAKIRKLNISKPDYSQAEQ
jgi:formate hydrogenlyase transcriptional activator